MTRSSLKKEDSAVPFIYLLLPADKVKLPDYIPYQYVLFKPLSLADSDENIRAVIFPVSPVELSGLVTLAGSVMPGTDPVQVPQGADCNSTAAFAYTETDNCVFLTPSWKD